MNKPVTAAPATGVDKVLGWIVAVGPVSALSSIRGRAGELGWVFAGKLALIGANAVLMFLLAEVMQLELYGVLVAAISGQLVLSRLLLLGVDFGMIRLRTLHKNESDQVVRAGLKVIYHAAAVVGVIVIGIGLVSFWWSSVPFWLLSSIYLGAVGTALVDYSYCYQLSEHQFRNAGLVQSGTGLARLILSAAAVLLVPSVPYLVFVVYPATSLISGSVLAASLARKYQPKSKSTGVWPLLRFSLWLGAANFAALTSLYLGTFVLLAFSLEEENGILGLCLALSMGFFAVYNAFGEYVSARIARLESAKEIPGFVATWLGVGLALAVACIPIALGMGVIIPRFLPPGFATMAKPLYLLSASMLILLIQSPLQSACVYLLRPHLVVFGWVIRVLVAAVLTVALARGWGALGAATAQLFASLASWIAFAVFVIVGIRSGTAARASDLNEGAVTLKT